MNPFVLIWVMTSAAGMLLSILLMIESILDLRALTGIGNGRVLHARGRVAVEAIRVVIYAGFLFIGIPALNAPTTEASPTIIILIGANVLMVVKSLISWYVRRAAGDMGLSAAEIEAEAVETAMRLRETADRAAVRLLELAARTAEAHPELQDTANRIADNTEQIAANTARQED